MHIDASCPSSSVWVLSFFANSEKSKIKSQKPSNFGSENSNDKKTAIAWKKLTEVTKGQTNLKCFFQADISYKKRTNEFYFITMKPQVDLFSFVFWRKLKTPKRHFEINWPLKELGLQQNISAKLDKKSVTSHHCVTRKAATVVSSFVVLFSSISCQDSSVRYLFAKQHSVVELHVQQLKVDFWERSNSKIYSSIGIKFR